MPERCRRCRPCRDAAAEKYAGPCRVALLGAEFLPLYLTLLVHLALLYGCVLLCDLAENRRCKALFSCLAEAVRCMAAVTALFFGLMAVGVAALMLSGG